MARFASYSSPTALQLAALAYANAPDEAIRSAGAFDLMRAAIEFTRATVALLPEPDAALRILEAL